MLLINYSQLRRQVSMEEVLSLVGFVPTTCHGNQLRGACPITPVKERNGQDDRYSFSVHLGRQVFHCFRCGKCGNQVDLWRFVHGGELYQASMDLCQQAGIDPPWLD